MVCSKERDKYPFDIQHRAIISYAADAPNDFTVLQGQITARLKVGVQRSETLRQISETETVAPVAGLSQNELAVLAVLAGDVSTTEGVARLWSIQQDAERAGLTKIGFTLSVRRLQAKALVRQGTDRDQDGDEFPTIGITELGWDWIEANEDRFVLQRPSKKRVEYLGESEITDDDIPF
jgi:hypothetical protein